MQLLQTLRKIFGFVLTVTIFGGIATLFFQLESLFYIMLAGFVLSFVAQVITLILIYLFNRA
jgi:hypothetical protein